LDLDSYIRHLMRVPFFRTAQEVPLVYITGKIQSVLPLLEVYTRIFELTDQFNAAGWVAYLALDNVGEFLNDARTWGDVEAVGEELYCWHTLPSPVLVATERNEASELRRAVAALERAPESGVVALASPSNGSTRIFSSKSTPPARSRIMSSDSLARMRFEREHSLDDLPGVSSGTRSPTPPSNPRIRRHTG
jgi:hypothetical protein